MAKIFQGEIRSRGKKYGIVVARFNEFITERLLSACLEQLKECSVKDSEITVAWVPGSWEIPVVALKMARKKTFDAVICLGAVIRGETFHFEVVAEGAAYGIQHAAIISGKPVVLGVITTETVKQAYARSSKADNKGRDAALTAVEMVNLIGKI